ncbi:hypothetical protein [Paraburkholderia sabiae]|uniref:hypothetical protein n=1 Tax=Paraburkholderia sabiae TaxID=273251 RepID=UPI001CC688A9|nr:hypothetical protein [Paraburkholderia sabiae]
MAVRHIARILAFVAVVLIPDPARADMSVDIIRIQCLSALGKVTVDTATTWNVCTDARCRNLQALQAHDMYEIGAFLKRFQASPFLCALPDEKTATVGIVDHGIDRGGDPWLRLEFKVGNLVVGHADTTEKNIDVSMDVISAPASVAFRACVTPVNGFMGLPDSIRCEQSWTDYNGKTMVDGQEKSRIYVPAVR